MQAENPMNAENIPVDIVYTWVDDQFPGYSNLLQQYAKTGHDTNPNRTRNNLDVLKYSLRSVEKYTPWIRNVYIFTARPQRPEWLNTANKRIKLIHHDEVIEREFLPTFNSFCIVSHLALLNDISDPFLYMEDDMLFASPTDVDDFIPEDRQIILRPRFDKTTNPARQHDRDQPPWNKALSYSNHLLDRRYGKQARHSINHVPVMIYKQLWIRMTEIWQEAFEHTRQCKFRELYNVAPEYLYQYFMLYENRAQMAGIRDTWRKTFYMGLENNMLLVRAGLFMLDRINPRFYCLNDNFGENPDPRIENFVRKYMERKYPLKSSFEM